MRLFQVAGTHVWRLELFSTDDRELFLRMLSPTWCFVKASGSGCLRTGHRLYGWEALLDKPAVAQKDPVKLAVPPVRDGNHSQRCLGS